MRNGTILISMAVISLFLSGCEFFRLPPTESQKLNAWLHYRTTALASELAVNEQGSESLRKLTNLSAAQSNAFIADYGLPANLPQLNSAQDILSQGNWDAAWQVLDDAKNAPTGWDIADGIVEFGIVVAGLLGGAYGLRFAGFLKQVQQKSTALREIVVGNELFKKQNTNLVDSFKSAHQLQSSETKQIVTQIKNENS